MAKKIQVRFGKVSQPFKVYQIAEGTTLISFLESRELSFNASIRVNGRVATKSTRLKAGDLVTSTENTSGGC